MNSKILVADDDAAVRKSIRLTLMGEPYLIIESGTLAQTHTALLAEEPDLLLLDVHFQEGATSLELLKCMASDGIRVPVVILSGAATASEAAAAIKLGAYDYLEKPPTAERLRTTLARCLEHARLKQQFERATTPSVSGILGDAPEMQKVRKLVAQFGPKDVKVLITGETGSGKEVVAQAIWKQSSRASRPFVVVNSAAIPETLIESELFGHRKGSFTGAVSDQVGKIEMAHGGTLFLDEIGELSLAAQNKLLRFLETGEIQKLGSNQVKVVDVRLIAATSRDLEVEIARGRFREDLFYRLNVAAIHVPPLREHPEDVPALFAEFVQSICRRFGEAPKRVEADALAALREHSWPGNVRELRNVAERAVVTAGDAIDSRVIGEILRAKTRATPRKGVPVSTDQVLPLKEFKNRAEREYIEAVLAIASGSVTQAAQLLKIDRTYLHQKMSQLGIRR